MGNFYVNVTLRGPEQGPIRQILEEAGYQAFVSPTVGGLTTVFEVGCDTQNGDHILAFTTWITQQLDCSALAVLNHDDDILWYGLFGSGVLDHEYNSAPDYFEDSLFDPDDELGINAEPLSTPEGGDAAALSAAFNPAADQGKLQSVLAAPSGDDAGYLFAVDRHRDLAAALGLPSFSVGLGYGYLDRGELPEGYGETDFVRTSGG